MTVRVTLKHSRTNSRMCSNTECTEPRPSNQVMPDVIVPDKVPALAYATMQHIEPADCIERYEIDGSA